MVSLKLSNVYDGVFRSELSFEVNGRNHAARERLAIVTDELRRNKGWSVIMRGHDFRLRDTPRDIVREPVRLRFKFEVKKRAEPKKTHYVPLRVRSYYTFLDSTLSPTAIVRLAKQNELPAITLMDVGNLHGAVFAQAAQNNGIKLHFRD